LDSLASLFRLNGFPTSSEDPAKDVVVAVIDDQPVSRTLLARLLRGVDATIDVKLFADPSAALAWLPDARPALIITDYRMPQMDGIEFVKALRRMENTKWTPIMLVTVLDDHQVKKRALQAGATDFLNKPIDHDECRARCRNLLELSSYQAFLLEQLSIRNAYIRSLHDTAGLPLETHVDETLDVTQKGRYVLMEYQELYEVTSTLAAMDKLLNTWRNKRASLEAAAKRPLQGDSTKD
jgi:CheY-like chemotaxis protein